MTRRLTITLAFIALITGSFRLPVAHAHGQMFSVRVSQRGFEENIDYTLTVEAGHPVTITFTYADGDLATDNPHEIRITGPGVEDLETVTISRDRLTASLSFTPQRTGLLRLVCITPCIGMENLTGAKIRVNRPRMSGASTFLTLDLLPRADGDVLARARLTDTNGAPIANAPVNFTLQTALGGDLALDKSSTMEDGSAVIRIPATGAENLRVLASFEGGEGLAYTETASEVAVSGIAMEHQPDSLSAPTAPPALALGLLVVLGGVWLTYGFVVYQVVLIQRRP